jgi:hypothetical protein
MKPDGMLDFAGVGPGAYTLRYIQISGETAKGGRRTVERGDSDVNDVVITATAAATVRGKVKSEGNPPANAAASDSKPISVALVASDVLVGPGAAATVDSDGTFAIRNVISPGRYVVRFDPPVGAYLKSIRCGQTNVTNSELDISDGGESEMEITYRYGLATLTGTVSRAPAGAADGPAPEVAHIVLVPKELDPIGRGVLFSSTGTDGSFSTGGIPPGRYRAYAFEVVDYSALHQPPVLKALESLGTEVELDDGASAATSLELISAERARRAIAVAANQ